MILIDRVYQTVLYILNKENTGYLTEDEFNSLANQAQNEIFRAYFPQEDRYLQQGRMNATDHSNLAMVIEEKINFFDVTRTIGGTSGNFDFPSDFYRLGTITVSGNYADEVSRKEIAYIEKSPLAASTTKQPKYVRREDGITIYPNSITSISMNFIRKPAIPLWVGGAQDGQAVPNTAGAGYQDFELHPSEEPELVAKILAYSGVLIRDPEAAGAGAQATQSIQQQDQ